MRALLIISSVFVFGCTSVKNNESYYSLSSGKDWEATIEPEEIENFVPWEQALDLLLQNPRAIEAVGQGHSLQVNIVFKTGSHIGTIEPDIDTIFLILDKCGVRCAHIMQITQ